MIRNKKLASVSISVIFVIAIFCWVGMSGSGAGIIRDDRLEGTEVLIGKTYKLSGYLQSSPPDETGRVCESLAIASGSPDLLLHLEGLVRDGNSINSINANNELVVTLGPSNAFRSLDGSGDVQMPITINVQLKPPRERDALSCESLLQMVNAEER